MQSFSTKYHDKFINFFKIKKNPWKIELWLLKKTEIYLKFLRFLPWLKMIWVWNSVSMNCAKEESDIDLFIVTTKNSMWFNRVFITLFFEILWLRKTKKTHIWKFCLSFFSTLDWLDFSSWKIKDDIYLYFWILYFKPILDYWDTYKVFLEKNSSWADFSSYNNLIDRNKKYIKYKKEYLASKSEWFFVKFLDYLLKKVFFSKTLKSYEILSKPYWVIINDDLLKFHDEDIRKTLRDKLV